MLYYFLFIESDLTYVNYLQAIVTHFIEGYTEFIKKQQM